MRMGMGLKGSWQYSWYLRNIARLLSIVLWNGNYDGGTEQLEADVVVFLEMKTVVIILSYWS